MDINSAKQVLLATHIASLELGRRANGMYLVSGPGIGKTEGTFQYTEDLARMTGRPAGLVQFMLATISSVDVRGFMIPTKSQTIPGVPDTVFSLPPWYPTQATMFVIEPDGTWHKPGTWSGGLPDIGVLFLDEFAQADDEVKKPAAELLYKGNVGTVELPQGWRVVAAGNRMSDRSGVMRELMFIVNRRCQLAIDASMSAWINWANAQKPANRPHYLTLSFAQKNPGLVFQDSAPTGTDPFCTPRTLCLLNHDLMALRETRDVAQDRLPTTPLAREVAAGWIGGGAAAQFFTHLKYADELPEISEIERAPKRAKVPDAKDAQMVCGYMLAHHVNEKNSDAFIEYIERLNIEMQVLAIRAIGAQANGAALAFNSAPGTVRWLGKNKDILIASQS